MPVPPLDKAWIAARIPHAGAMCLLDRVVSWSADAIHCEASSHMAPDNPLRSAGRLAAVCGIEYAAQAMAVHAALLAASRDGAEGAEGAEGGGGPDGMPSARPRMGYLAGIRKVQAHTDRLDAWPGPLRVEATRISGDGIVVLYAFALYADAPAHGPMHTPTPTTMHAASPAPIDASPAHCLLSGRATVMLAAPA